MHRRQVCMTSWQSSKTVNCSAKIQILNCMCSVHASIVHERHGPIIRLHKTKTVHESCHKIIKKYAHVFSQHVLMTLDCGLWQGILSIVINLCHLYYSYLWPLNLNWQIKYLVIDNELSMTYYFAAKLHVKYLGNCVDCCVRLLLCRCVNAHPLHGQKRLLAFCDT